MCVMMMVTVCDVVLRSLFAYPIFGTFDVVELCLVSFIFFALPETFRREEHVVIDIVDHVAPPHVVEGLQVLAAGITTMFLAVLLWRAIPPAYDTYLFGDRTLDLGLPRFIHWLPILLGTGIAILVTLSILVRTIAGVRGSGGAR